MSFAASTMTDQIAKRVSEMAAQRPEVRVILSMLDAERHPEWAHTLGAVSDPILRSLVPPIPPLNLRSIVANPTEEVFLWEGFRDICHFIDLFEEFAGNDFPTRPRILDFGCGCGRLTRFLSMVPNLSVSACDLNPEHIEWCRQNLPTITALVNQPEPPLPFNTSAFDFAYLLSVFTHLREPATLAWMEELSRVVRPGGLVIITTHGYPTLQTIERSTAHQKLVEISGKKAAEIALALKYDGYVYVPYRPEVQVNANVNTEYGNSFIDPDHAKAAWSSHFEVLIHIPGDLRGWQDVYVLRRL
jgi:SAM-dependent methyltransferase